MSHLSALFQARVAALETRIRENTRIRNKIFEGGSEEAKLIALRLASEHVEQESQALQRLNSGSYQDPEQPTGSVSSEPAQTNSEQTKCTDCIAWLLRQKSKDAKDKMKNENRRLLLGCIELRKRADNVEAAKTKSRELQEEIRAEKEQNISLKQLSTMLKVPQDDSEQRCVQLQEKRDKLKRENEELRENCARIQNDQEQDPKITKLEEEIEALTRQKRESQKQLKKLTSKLPQESMKERFLQLQTSETR
ncbi:hypothetical protein WMY93_032743 [Mugilogobius chulae]|uniref:Uncharacterized protein n=1 Tax=Mugilogobius chulae TaxID=88201 RepID=A0AAW0MVH5_9GOBI